MRSALDLWPFDLKIDRVHPWFIGSECAKFHDHRFITEPVIQSRLSYATLQGTFMKRSHITGGLLLQSPQNDLEDRQCMTSQHFPNRMKSLAVLLALLNMNKTNHPISSSSHTPTTANIAIHCLNMGWGLQNQREHNIILTKYEAVHPTAVWENNSSSGILII